MSGLPPPPPPLSGMGGGPPPPPPPPGIGVYNLPVVNLPQINVPKPRTKMKTLQWQKIPVNNVIGKPNIWTIIGHLEKKYEMDYEKMDELFSVSHDSGVRLHGQDISGPSDNKKKRENMEINILDGKRSLNVNIFLKQFRMEHQEIVQMLREGRCEKFGAERLRSLLKLLPSEEEIDAINAFVGDSDKLGNAERFFICLMKLPNYRMRIEGLLIMEEFNVNMEWIRPSIEAVIQAAKDIQESQSLKELIYLILISGNYLNSGNYAGNAAGFKLSSLLKLTEIRANKPRMNLMHYVAQEAEEKNPKLLKFPDEMLFLKDAAQVSIETLNADIDNIASKVRALTEQIVLAGADFQQQMAHFLKDANIEVRELEEDLSDIEIIRQELATFFCEEIKTFKLEECFRILQTFCQRLKKATEENIQRCIQEAKAERRRKSKEIEENRKSTIAIGDNSMDCSTEEHEHSSVDTLLADVRSGFVSRKFNDGNFSITKVTKVNLSPADISAGDSSIDSIDISSPTLDSLAQKRSRRSYATEDNESLMEFLMENSELSKEPTKPESQFDRYATLRRRRLEKKAKHNVLQVIERERTPTPVDFNSSSPIDTLTETPVTTKLEVNSKASNGNKLQRSKSWLDKPSVEKARSEYRKKEYKDDNDESEALIQRLKQRLNRKDGRSTPTLTDDVDGSTIQSHQNSAVSDTTPGTRKNSRWRSGIAVSDNTSTLETIAEKNQCLDASESKSAEKTQERISTKENRTAQNTDAFSSAAAKPSKDDSAFSPSVMVSMRKKISSGMGTDIDGVLKTIEDTGRQIDTVGVTGPMKRTPDTNKSKIQPQVAVVAHVTSSNIPSTPIIEQELKAKRDKRKKRSTLSVDDVKAAMKLDGTPKDVESINTVNTSVKRVSSNTHKSSPAASKAKTPPVQRRLRSNSDKTDNEKVLVTEDGNNKDHNKAAKLAAARKRFRGARFGISGTSETNASLRARSNVEPDCVDQALKEIACQSNMSRSKSYDEHVAKKALAGEEDFATNGIMRMNSSSAPDTSAEKCAFMRNSVNRLSVDGRRNGLYIPGDDSDTEQRPEDICTRRSSKSDSPKSFSQLSLKSVNTSTETLQSEIDSYAEQSIKNIGPQSHNSNLVNASVMYSVKPIDSFPSDTPVFVNDNSSSFRRSYSLMEKRKDTEEEGENPLAAVAKWKLRRAQRRSVYDNVNNSASPDSITSAIQKHSQSEENDLKNESGSRSSYASSNDRDEGFETASGTLSQRTSMNSNLEAEMSNTPILSRRIEHTKPKGINEILPHKKSVSKEDDSVISRLSEEADRKERTQNWTEQTVKVNVVNNDDTNSEFCDTLSPNNGHGTSKEDNSKSAKATSPTKHGVTAISTKKTSTEDATKSGKQKAVPSYMQPTSSSANKPVQNKVTSPTKTSTLASATAFVRDIPSRLSTRDQTPATAFKRDTARASMRAETATAAFQRGTVARTSVRGPRSSIGSTKSFLSPQGPSRTRSDSNASISSTTSSTSNISTTPSTHSEATRRRLAPSTTGSLSHGSGRPTTPSTHLTVSRATASPRASTPTSPRAITPTSPRAITPASHIKASTTPSNGTFTRTQSLRVSSGRTSLGNDTKHTISNSTDGRRSVTPISHKSPSLTPSLPQRPQSTTPLSSENKPARRSSFMAPTASSKAKVDEQAPVAPPRTNSLSRSSNVNSFTRSSSLRMPKNLSGRVSPATIESPLLHKPDHHQSLSTVAEQAGDDEKLEETPKKSTSFFKRLGAGKAKVFSTEAKTSIKSASIATVAKK